MTTNKWFTGFTTAEWTADIKQVRHCCTSMMIRELLKSEILHCDHSLQIPLNWLQNKLEKRFTHSAAYYRFANATITRISTIVLTALIYHHISNPQEKP